VTIRMRDSDVYKNQGFFVRHTLNDQRAMLQDDVWQGLGFDLDKAKGDSSSISGVLDAYSSNCVRLTRA
jgi:hypothetical protein